MSDGHEYCPSCDQRATEWQKMLPPIGRCANGHAWKESEGLDGTTAATRFHGVRLTPAVRGISADGAHITGNVALFSIGPGAPGIDARGRVLGDGTHVVVVDAAAPPSVRHTAEGGTITTYGTGSAVNASAERGARLVVGTFDTDADLLAALERDATLRSKGQ